MNDDDVEAEDDEEEKIRVEVGWAHFFLVSLLLLCVDDDDVFL